MVTPVGAVQEIQADCTAGVRGMHKAAFTDINADVGHIASGAEKHQITASQFFRRNARTLDRSQFA